jgi:hypothetical protein
MSFRHTTNSTIVQLPQNWHRSNRTREPKTPTKANRATTRSNMCEPDLRAHEPCPVLQSWFLANMWCHWSARAHWSRLEISAIRHRKRLLPFFKELQDAPRPKEMHSPVNQCHDNTPDRVNTAISTMLHDSHVSSRATIVPS